MRAARIALGLAVIGAAASSFPVIGPGAAQAAGQRFAPPVFRSPALEAAAASLRADDFPEAVRRLDKALGKRGRVRKGERLAAEYMRAFARMRAGDCAGAAPVFERLASRYRVLLPYHAYNAAICHVRNRDLPEAITAARRVPDDHPLRAEAALVEIEVLSMQDRLPALVTAARAYLAQHPGGPRRAEVNQRLGGALERLGQIDEAAAAYRAAWRSGGTGRHAVQAEERLGALAPAHPAARKRAEDWIVRGMFFFDRHQNDEAERTFGEALALRERTAGETCTATYHRAQSLWKAKSRARALPLFSEAIEICARAGDPDLTAKARYQHARCLVAAGRKDEALKAFVALADGHAAHPYADDALLRAAEVEEDLGAADRMAERLRSLRTRHPGGDMLGESLWRLAFAPYLAGDFAAAEARLREALVALPREDIWYAEGRTLYWLARVLERRGRQEEALDFYERAIREYPLSYYALLGLSRLRARDPDRASRLTALLRDGAGKALPAWVERDLPRRLDPRILRAAELTRMGLEEDVGRELASFGDSWRQAQTGPDRLREAMNAQYWVVASLLDRAGVWKLSHAVPRHRLRAYRLAYPTGRTGTMWRLAFPTAFPDLVRQNAETAGISPALVWGLMREESAYDPAAVSPASCYGLTMLKVSTAAEALKRPVTREALFEPATNVQAGAAYLGKLVRRFDGATPLAIAAYNGGASSVDRWLKAWPSRDLDELLELVPFEETRNYTKRVLASYFAYAWIYAPAELPRLLTSELRRADPRSAATPAAR